jgi:purine nucleosidase
MCYPRCLIIAVCSAILAFASPLASPASQEERRPDPVKIIFDTDIGNDVDDVLALSVLHALQSRAQCEILAITITKPDELAGPFVDAINTFYSRPQIPIGFTHSKLKNDPSKFLPLAETKDNGELRFSRRVQRSSELPEATLLLRRILATQPDKSVVLVQVGYFSNFAALLDTIPDSTSPLSGRELAEKKVKLLSVMAGCFKTKERFREYNVVQDLPAAKKLCKGWPTAIVWSGFEIGIAIPFPAISIERDFSYVAHHPAAEAYRLYEPPPHERPTWDLTSTLYAVFPERKFFDLSPPGEVTIEEDGFTSFKPSEHGRDRYLVVNEIQIARVKEALVQLAIEPPSASARGH